jgi:hypothetical protein
LHRGNSVTAAAVAIGISRAAIYRWRREDEALRNEWDDAVEAITEDIEAALARAA